MDNKMNESEVYKAIAEGRMTLEQFEDWMSEQTLESYKNGSDDANYYNAMNS